MTARTRRRFRATLLALCCLLLAQWSLVTHACPVIKLAGELTSQAALATERQAQGAHDCHTAAPEDVPTTTLCLKHCADEGSASSSVALAAVAAPPPLVLRATLPVAAGPLHWEQAPARDDATAPPISILYCICLS
jgi:hypothetical protein